MISMMLMRNVSMRRHVPSRISRLFDLTHVSSQSSDPFILLDRMVSSDIDDAQSLTTLGLSSWLVWQEKLQYAAG